MVMAQRDRHAFLRDNPVCVVCGSEEELRVDHIVPRIKGGTDDLDNLQTLCNYCNVQKRDKDNDYWMRYYARRPDRPSATEALERAMGWT